MEKNKETTVVKFYYEKGSKTEIFAYFPEESAFDSQGNKPSYAHVGQHSACSKEYVKTCKRCRVEADHMPLYKELESLGYNLIISN